MENKREYEISFLSGFADKSLEKEYFYYEMKRYATIIGPVTLIFGVVYMMFIISDYYAIENHFSFMIILTMRSMLLILSVFIYLLIKNVNNYANLAYLITVYEIFAIVAFLVILYQYKSLSYLSFFSLMALTFALYIMPNNLKYAQIISVFLNGMFFIFLSKHIIGLEYSVLLKIIAYNLMLILYCNIEAYMNRYYKRKQFAYSRELLILSTTDSLTGIYNRAKFNEELNKWVDYSNRYENPLSLAILDIDNFKRINDIYGHLVGDSVLQKISLTINNTIRSTDVFARWGGEEFVILLPNTDANQAMEMTERIRICIFSNKYYKEEIITCSFGLVELGKNESAEYMLKRADKFLYDAKESGKNVVICEYGGINKKTEQYI